MNREEYDSIIEFLRQIYRNHGKNGLLIRQQNNFSWLFNGNSFVGTSSVSGVVDVLINDEAVYLVANKIEAQRIISEEIRGDFGIILKDYEWYEGSEGERIIKGLTGGSYVKDSEVEKEIKSLRLVMTPTQLKAYEELGTDASSIIEETCFEVKRGDSERKAASIMAQKCVERGIEPVILLVAADERINQYRHPLPTGKIIDRYVMLVIGARRQGQIIGITRFVSFGDISEDIVRKRDAVSNIYAMLLGETRPGKKGSDLFKLLVDAYGEQGYPSEWKLHHQGGIIGYNSREYKFDFNTDVNIEIGQCFAWNPSITGFKHEDVFVVDKSGNRVITNTPNLPYRSYKYKDGIYSCPDILIR